MSRDIAAGCHRQSDGDIGYSGVAINVDGERGAENLGKACSGATRDRTKLIQGGPLQIGGLAEKTIGPRRRTMAETEAPRLRPVRQRFSPALPILRKPARCPVRNIFVHQFSERTKAVITGGISAMKPCVNVSDTTGDQPHAKRIQDDVVITRVPVETGVQFLEQRESK